MKAEASPELEANAQLESKSESKAEMQVQVEDRDREVDGEAAAADDRLAPLLDEAGHLSIPVRAGIVFVASQALFADPKHVQVRGRSHLSSPRCYGGNSPPSGLDGPGVTCQQTCAPGRRAK